MQLAQTAVQWTALNKLLLDHWEERDCLAMLFSGVFHRWEQSLLHSHLQLQKTVVHSPHFPTTEQAVHDVWTSSEPATPQLTAFSGASSRFPRIKAKCTLGVSRPTHLGLLSFFFFLFDSYWELLAFPSDGAELLATCPVGSCSMSSLSSHCTVLKNKDGNTNAALNS